ncbi:MAG TPA: beta-L-arabinofuranosidase domain-containing protein [Agromyces sp.]|nr:beta-L-arabinofuranosidase domain-containing protein [Agromyces sp.]
MTVSTRTPSAPVAPSRSRLRPLGLDEVAIRGGFWGDRQEVNGRATLAHIAGWLEREGWLGNFDLAASGRLPEGRRGREFSDSEVYKYLEAVAWEIGRRGGDAELEERFRSVVARVAAAQEPDGYLNTRFGRPGQDPRWANLEWGHELYCLGHLFQAAVARVRTRPDADDGLFDIARRAADLVCKVFGDDGIQSICGHAEIEIGLVELARATGDERYLRQAQLFVERHGTGVLPDIEFGRSYYQDDIPVREADVLRGHAVRANYLAAGAVDLAVETADEGLLDALERQWTNTIARRTYVTGGQGSHHQDEAFGDDFELPPDRAYSETCAGVASVMFSWRMLLAKGDARYADLIERTLFNVVATSPSAEGTAFYYANTLHQRRPGEHADPDEVSPRASSSLRAPWFEVACCPPNVARTFASLAAYVATADADGVQLHQYAPASIRTTLDDGREIALEVETAYPAEGSVRVRVLTDAAEPWTLSLRVPAWAESAKLVVRLNGEEHVQTWQAEPGTVSCSKAFSAGDVVELEFPIVPRFTSPDPRIDAVRGCLVVERGPEVFALESIDLVEAGIGATDVADIVLDASMPPREVDGRVLVAVRERHPEIASWPYGDETGMGSTAASVQEVALVPYHEWAERGPSTMRVWIPAT